MILGATAGPRERTAVPKADNHAGAYAFLMGLDPGRLW